MADRVWGRMDGKGGYGFVARHTPLAPFLKDMSVAIFSEHTLFQGIQGRTDE